jgi:hypothetical protein
LDNSTADNSYIRSNIGLLHFSIDFLLRVNQSSVVHGSPEASLDVLTAKARISISRATPNHGLVWQCCVPEGFKDVVVRAWIRKQAIYGRIIWIEIIIESRNGQTQLHCTQQTLEELWMSSHDSHLMPLQTSGRAVAGLFPSIHSTQ